LVVYFFRLIRALNSPSTGKERYHVLKTANSALAKLALR